MGLMWGQRERSHTEAPRPFSLSSAVGSDAIYYDKEDWRWEHDIFGGKKSRNLFTMYIFIHVKSEISDIYVGISSKYSRVQ